MTRPSPAAPILAVLDCYSLIPKAENNGKQLASQSVARCSAYSRRL